MITDAPNITHLWGTLVVEELARCGVTHFCLSPGSRSTPLAWAVASNPGVTAHVHLDERGTAFFALGMAKALQEPVALVCTSGTAVANFLPAVVEASQSYVPLIVLTGDRPPELLDTAANQTIDQAKIFGDYVRWSHTLPAPDAAIAPEIVLTAVDQAIHRARSAPAGPVHLNCMFREPLHPVATGFDSAAYLTYRRAWLNGEAPYTQYIEARPTASEEDLAALAAELSGIARGLLVVGQLDSLDEARAVEAFAQTLGWPVFPDIASGLRLGDTAGLTVHNYDQLLVSQSFHDHLRPQAVLHLGGAVTSKRLVQFVASQQDLAYTLVAPHPRRQDPNHRVSRRVQMRVDDFCGAIASRIAGSVDDDWKQWVYAQSLEVQTTVETWLAKKGELTEIAVARRTSELLPQDSVLYLGNSMPIRDMDMYGAPGGARVRVAVNRGASGIDGNIATAAGYAAALGRPVTAILGDLAALHDLNSMLLLQQTDAPVVLVIVNNNGGGIFSFLPIADHHEHFERFFGTPHGLRFDKAAAMFGVAHVSPDSPRAFADAYHSAIHGRESVILEVITDREENVRAHKALQEELARR